MAKVSWTDVGHQMDPATLTCAKCGLTAAAFLNAQPTETLECPVALPPPVSSTLSPALYSWDTETLPEPKVLGPGHIGEIHVDFGTIPLVEVIQEMLSKLSASFKHVAGPPVFIVPSNWIGDPEMITLQPRRRREPGPRKHGTVQLIQPYREEM